MAIGIEKRPQRYAIPTGVASVMAHSKCKLPGAEYVRNASPQVRKVVGAQVAHDLPAGMQVQYPAGKYFRIPVGLQVGRTAGGNLCSGKRIEGQASKMLVEGIPCGGTETIVQVSQLEFLRV